MARSVLAKGWIPFRTSNRLLWYADCEKLWKIALQPRVIKPIFAGALCVWLVDNTDESPTADYTRDRGLEITEVKRWNDVILG